MLINFYPKLKSNKIENEYAIKKKKNNKENKIIFF